MFSLDSCLSTVVDLVGTVIRRPLQSVERVRLHLLAYNIQSLSNSHPSKQGPEEAISPASPGGQAAGIEESYPPGTQAAGIQDLGARMLGSRNLIILSSSIGDLLGRNRLPQGAGGSGPESSKSLQIGAPACTGVPNSLFGHPGYSSGAQVAPGPCSRHQRWSKASKM